MTPTKASTSNYQLQSHWSIIWKRKIVPQLPFAFLFSPFPCIRDMKVPFLNCITTFPATTTTDTSTYEPKSVLDLGRSPTPLAHRPDTDILAALIADVDPLQLEDDHHHDHVLINQHSVDDWDSLMRELGLHDDSTKPITHHQQLTDSHPPPETSFDSNHFVPDDFGPPLNSFQGHSGEFAGARNWNQLGLDYELIRFAECFDTNSLQLAHVILARLNQRLGAPTGKPLQRAAFYFKEALQSVLTGSTRPDDSDSDIIQTIKAQKTFSSISPIPLFSSFTANQAVLEAVDGWANVHIIDFEIGLGGQWASFMKELADKAGSRKAAPPALRISAIVSEEYSLESRLMRENLTQFARDLNIRFDIHLISIKTFQYLSFKAIKLIDGERVAVLLSPVIFRQVGTGFLNDLRRISPRVVVHMDTEGLMDFGTMSYRQTVIDGLEFYSTLLESLEAANFNGGDDGWVRSIETYVVFPKIVEAARRVGTPWREAAAAAGLREVALSQFAEFQAECLLKRVQVRGFHVVKRQGEMLLCWHDRPIVATSVWSY